MGEQNKKGVPEGLPKSTVKIMVIWGVRGRKMGLITHRGGSVHLVVVTHIRISLRHLVVWMMVVVVRVLHRSVAVKVSVPVSLVVRNRRMLNRVLAGHVRHVK